MIFANYPGSAEIERAINEAFEVTRAAATIKEFNGRKVENYTEEERLLLEYDQTDLTISRQAHLLGRSVGWVKNQRYNLGLTRPKQP